MNGKYEFTYTTHDDYGRCSCTCTGERAYEVLGQVLLYSTSFMPLPPETIARAILYLGETGAMDEWLDQPPSNAIAEAYVELERAAEGVVKAYEDYRARFQRPRAPASETGAQTGGGA